MIGFSLTVERVRAGVWLLALVLLLAPGISRAQEAWLVTYGPGAEVWELFGHNALWLRDPATGLDHTYSFGYFEIDRPGFHLDFARGIMLYYGAASPAEREFAFYRARGRSIQVQRLNLSATQVAELHRSLHQAIHPHPQYYAYDYFRANCSTWLRDLIDQRVDGRVSDVLREQPARLNFRDHVRRMTFDRPWIQTGILMLMGPSIDQPISAWDETFLPEALASWLEVVEVQGRPLVAERQMLHDPGNFEPPSQPRGPWLMMLAFGLAAAAGLLWAGRRDQGWARWPGRVLIFAAGLAGALLLLMWFGSGHPDTAANLLVLLLNPLWWLLLLPLGVRWRRLVLLVLAGGLLVGSVILAWPGLWQDRPDQLALLLPPLLVLLLQAGRPPTPAARS